MDHKGYQGSLHKIEQIIYPLLQGLGMHAPLRIQDQIYPKKINKNNT